MTLATAADAFDYATTVFGDEDIVDLSTRTWGALRMRRCLDSLADVHGTVLEVGCGAGRNVRTIKHYRPDLRVCGCDLSTAAVAAAWRYADGVTYDVADVGALPYGDAVFDAVVVMDLLEHVPDIARALGELRRVTRLHGRLHLHVPCEGSRLCLYAPLLAMGIDLTARAVGHCHHLRRADVFRLLRTAGFEPLRVRHSVYPFGQLHDVCGWLTMLQRNQQAGEAEACADGSRAMSRGGEPQADTAPYPTVFARAQRWRRLFTRPAWRVVQALLPRLQYWETVVWGWQPLGAVGLCVTAARR